MILQQRYHTVGLEEYQPEVNLIGDLMDDVVLVHQECYLTMPVGDCVAFLDALTRSVECNDWQQTELQIDEGLMLFRPEQTTGFVVERTEPIANLGRRIAESLGAREDQCVPVVTWGQFGVWLTFDHEGVVDAMCTTVQQWMKCGPYVRRGQTRPLAAREGDDKFMPSNLLDEQFGDCFCEPGICWPEDVIP